eukprot:m.480737 g.480737  ORF g.480737 m.480737 type:complete len:402 (-) comp21937_c0_seq1:2236-3441(-)
MARLVAAAETVARERGHVMVGTEHVLFVLCTCTPSSTFAAGAYLDHCVDRAAIAAAIEAVPFCTQHSGDGSHPATDEPLFRSPSLEAVVQLAQALNAASRTPAHALLSEEVLAALILHGANFAAIILRTSDHGDVDPAALLVQLNVDPKTAGLRRGDGQPKCWSEFTIGKGKGVEDTASSSADASAAKLSLPALPDDHAAMTGPTRWSNWLVPGRVLIGRCPGSWGYCSERETAEELASILACGIDTFVCLIGEMHVGEYRASYPRVCEKQKMMTQGSPTPRPVKFVHFGIDDFDVASDPDTVAFVSELAARVRRGDRLYIHCYGGHGRTGIVAIALLSALYDLPTSDSIKLVNAYHDTRDACKSHHYPGRPAMPEDRSQFDQLKALDKVYRREAKKSGLL